MTRFGDTDARADLVALGLLVAGAAAMLWELITLVGVPVARDMQMFFVPQKHLVWEALHNARVPLWSAYFGSGAPLMANFQSGVFYPPHWALAVLPFFAAFNLLVAFHFTLGGVSAYLLGRKIRMSPPAAFGCAAMWMLGGYYASLLNLMNGLQAAAWAPLLVYTVLDHLERRTLGSLGRFAVVLLLLLLAGEPQVVALTALVTSVVMQVRWRQHAGSARALPLLASFAVAVLFVIGLAMIQILPTLELLGESGRGTGLPYEEAAFYSLEPLRLINLFVPQSYADPTYRFGYRATIGLRDPYLYSIYPGVLWLLLLIFAWRDAARRRELVAWSGLAALGLLMALGHETPVFRIAFEHIPGVSAFRYPEKYFFLSALSLAVIGGFGIDAIRERRWRRTDPWLAAVVVLSLGSLRISWAAARGWLAERAGSFAYFAAQDNFDFAYGVWTRQLDTTLLIVLAAFVLVWLFRTGHLHLRLFTILLISLVSIDLGVAHRGLNPVVETEFYERTPLIASSLPLEEVRRDYRYWATGVDRLTGVVRVVRGVPIEAQKWMWQQTIAPNTGQFHRVLQHDSWDAIKLRRNVDERELLAILPEDDPRRWRLLRLNSVRYVYSLGALADGPFRRGAPLDSIPGQLYEVENPVPRAVVVHRTTYHKDEVEVINAVLEDAFDPMREVALIGDGGPAADPETDPEAPRSSARILSDTGEEVRIAVSVDRPGHLVLTDNFYPGWSAWVDGEEREVRLANFFFRAVVVGPEDSEVVFRYRSPAYERGRAITLTMLVLGLISSVAAGVLRRRNASVD